jgi:hypothetical protein
MRRRALVLGSAAALIMAACSSGGHRASPSTLSAPPVTTAVTQPAGANPDAIPAVITPAYVDAVFKVLNHINGNVSRSLLASDQLTIGARIYLRAIYDDPLYRRELQLARESLQGNLSNVRKQPGDVLTTVRSLVFASNKCIFVETESDFSAVLVNPGKSAPSEYFRLAIKAPGIDPDHVNPTPWALNFNATFLTPTKVPNQCAA